MLEHGADSETCGTGEARFAPVARARRLESRASRRAVLLAVCVWWVAGCVQQADLVKQEKELTAKIAKARADLDQLIGETRARFNQELAALREEELPALRGSMDKGANRFEALQRRLDDVESRTAGRLNVLEKIQHDQANLLKAERDRAEADRDRLQGELAKLAETVGALAKAVETRLGTHDKTLGAQAVQLEQLAQGFADLAKKVDTDAKVTTEHLAAVNKSIASVSQALRKVGEAVEARDAEQDRRLEEIIKTVQGLGKAVEARQAQQDRRLGDLAKALEKTSEAAAARDLEQERRLNELIKTVNGLAARVEGGKGGKSKKGEKHPAKGPPAVSEPKDGDRTSAALAGLSPASVAAVGPDGDHDTDSEQASYDRSLQRYREGEYEEAGRGFSEFLARYPQSKLAGHAQYWLGECYYGAREYGRAIEAFDRVQQAYPDSPKVAAALLKKGFAYAALNDPERASSVLKQVMETYPKSPEATKAKEKLAQLQ